MDEKLVDSSRGTVVPQNFGCAVIEEWYQESRWTPCKTSQRSIWECGIQRFQTRVMTHVQVYLHTCSSSYILEQRICPLFTSNSLSNIDSLILYLYQIFFSPWHGHVRGHLLCPSLGMLSHWHSHLPMIMITSHTHILHPGWTAPCFGPSLTPCLFL